MTKLKISVLPDGKPVRLTVELPTSVHRDLQAYSELLAREVGEPNDLSRLVAAMVARFMETDRAFAKLRRDLPKRI